MAARRGGPRQPLSQLRPKVARQKGQKINPRAKPRKSAGAPGPPATAARKRHGKPRSAAQQREHADGVFRRLLALYPDGHCELDYRSPWQLLVATILSAQCTDKRVNMVTPALFERYPTPGALSDARQEDVEEIIRSTGFFRNKARNLIAMAAALQDRHAGAIPPTMKDLVSLPGVGRKTANVVLGNACGVNEGVVVDTHVHRLSRRLGLTTNDDPVRIEEDLMRLYERSRWTMLSHLLIWHGRRLCFARKPLCGQCPLAAICPSAGRV